MFVRTLLLKKTPSPITREWTGIAGYSQPGIVGFTLQTAVHLSIPWITFKRRGELHFYARRHSVSAKKDGLGDWKCKVERWDINVKFHLIPCWTNDLLMSVVELKFICKKINTKLIKVALTTHTNNFATVDFRVKVGLFSNPWNFAEN